MTKKIIDENYNYYKMHRIDFAKKYDNKFLVISGLKVQGDFTTFQKAYDFGVKNFGIGNFIIQQSNFMGAIEYLSRLEYC